ncbi:MAG: 4-hydroxy-tetrahydrodipicolinate reductase [Oscillospiraceae bacterium]|jgi:4-hydroxy-tetrahydrodipicolinate reductase|nr:4-hydroxy-tetrahydrodipicolinate reductase [Oscillospiraceae bacterium]
MKLFLSGYGRMGKMIEELALAKGWEIIGWADITCPERYDTAPKADVCIDFSGVGALPKLAEYIRRTGTALVSGTTGYTDPDFAVLQELAELVPVIWASNYSTGIAVLRRILREYAPVLSDWDKELIELHHNKKIDAPSGTAKTLLKELDPQGSSAVIHGREGICGARSKGEIGVFALRGGTVAGEHSVLFFGEDESLELTHKASSRRIFAAGALRAAESLADKAPGYYDLENLLFQ